MTKKGKKPYMGRDNLIVKIVGGATKAGIEPDRKKKENKSRSRGKIKPTAKPEKTPKKKNNPESEPWTQERVSALYGLFANTPQIQKLPDGNGTTHPGSPHEWEWEGEVMMGPICLSCNATGEYVEKIERYGNEDRISDSELFDDGFGDDILDDRYF
jgi:hypothetical protein